MGCTIARAVNYYVLTTEVCIQSQDNPYRICVGQNGTVNLPMATAVFACKLLFHQYSVPTQSQGKT
jgi:hypothetical protein